MDRGKCHKKRTLPHFMVQYLLWGHYENFDEGHMERMLFTDFYDLISGNLDWSVCCKTLDVRPLHQCPQFIQPGTSLGTIGYLGG